MPTICDTGLLFADRLLSHRQMEILHLVGEYPNGIHRGELTEDLFERYGRASKHTRHAPLTASERASLSRSIKRLVDAGLCVQNRQMLRLTDHGKLFMESMRENQAWRNYLQFYGRTWCKQARRIVGCGEDERITVDEATHAWSVHTMRAYG